MINPTGFIEVSERTKQLRWQMQNWLQAVEKQLSELEKLSKQAGYLHREAALMRYDLDEQRISLLRRTKELARGEHTNECLDLLEMDLQLQMGKWLSRNYDKEIRSVAKKMRNQDGFEKD